MKKSLIAFFFISIGITCVKAQEISCSDSLKLREQLSSIRKRDQEIRVRIIKEMAGKSPEEIKAAAIEMKASDKENQLLIASLLNRCGWPQGLSALENNTIFLVIDHADTAYMARYFPLLKAQTEIGVVSKSDFATLQDRMLLRSGKKQIYGTQTFKIGTVVTIWPVEDPEGLNSRRKAMGLSDIEDYIILLKKTYKSEIVWDKQMTAEQANKKMTLKN